MDIDGSCSCYFFGFMMFMMFMEVGIIDFLVVVSTNIYGFVVLVSVVTIFG